MELNKITGQIIGSAMKVHSVLGPGLLESAYEACLAYEFEKKGLIVERQKALPLIYDRLMIDVGYRLDILVCDSIIVELKAVDRLLPIHEAQLLSYLRLSEKKIGLLLNFNVVHMTEGIKRLVNNL